MSMVIRNSSGHRDKDGKLQLKTVTSSESSEISMAVGMFLWCPWYFGQVLSGNCDDIPEAWSFEMRPGKVHVTKSHGDWVYNESI